MGFGVTELLIILAIIVLLFGTRKLKNMGGDLGGAIKSFRTAMHDADKSDESESTPKVERGEDGKTIDGEVVSKSDKDHVQ